VIVNDFDPVRVSLTPHEANSKLIVDSDAVLTFAVLVEYLKVVARRYFKVF
jgi:hypothetical protein